MSLFSELFNWGRGQNTDSCYSFSEKAKMGGEKMNKKILMLLVSVLALAMLAVPVMAIPTNGPNKVAVTVDMTRNDTPPGWPGPGPYPGEEIDPNRFTGVIIHLYRIQCYDVTITFEDTTFITGTLEVERKIVNVKQGHRVIMSDHYVFTLDDGAVARGFEGNGQVLLDNVKGRSLAWGLFHGTGAFEGQTLNIGHPWVAYGGGGPAPWTGYWLKR